MERTRQEWGHRGGELTQSGTDIKVGKEPAFCWPPENPGSPHCPGLRGDWAEQRKAEASDPVESTVKPSGLGSLLLPPGKALGQGNSLKKVFGRRAARGWFPSRDADGRFPGLPAMRKHLSPQEQRFSVSQMAFQLC